MRPQIYTAADGRRIAFARYGDPDGLPVAYCHGTPSSRLEAAVAEAAARKLGLCLFAPDRPGYGRSDPLPPTNVAAWTGDLAAVADHLGIPRFHVVGVSGGGPYALACAARLEKRVRGVALVCPLGPIQDPALRRTMSPAARLAFFLAEKAPWALPLFFGPATAALLRRFPRLTFTLLESQLPESDRRTLADRRIRTCFEASIREGLRQGGRGARRDFVHYVRQWGFEPAAVGQKVTLWHGEADRVVPVTQSRILAGRLPRCETRFLAGEGHYSLPCRQAESILYHLVLG
ncbi:hypothetical protein MIN45_P2228 [Methylomarinovum tepidoasis]|uniref:AB hydrolase-1 domain-containing protein n=1 Tax=Methylomarinovum tepidoasis TaxID=2840183 RepID=A0AAU9C180_9GAMM|nr:hypothetical protein MIN45_P2228 [Methylomarinovum sp. IN45]